MAIGHLKPFLVILSVFLLVSSSCNYWVIAQQQVPCYFIFGDSLSDNGNNNFLLTLARSNYKPYGIDFPGGATGRFTNARNLVDIIAQLLGFRSFIPPFAIARGQQILQGVNYASGGAGIRDDSGRTLGDRITMNEQLQNHQRTITSLKKLLGSRNATETLLNKCIYTVAMGSNDYLNNYFLPLLYSTSTQFTPEQYAAVLAQQFSQQLQVLYNSGARKVAVLGVGLVGCTPYAISTFGRSNGSTCVDTINNAIQLFNVRVKTLVNQFNTNLSGAKFTFIDAFVIGATSPIPAGVISDAPCCQLGAGQIQCSPFTTPCANRTQYIFWDGVHPTEFGILGFAARAYQAQLPVDAQPYDIRQLAQL